MPEGYDSTGQETCKLFVKTGACRFFDRCKLLHPTPVLSQTLLVPNFFSHFLLQESLRDEYDMDLGLEYEKSELQIEFLEFYQDVLPEFQKHGKVIQFKVCCNFEAHLRGNVYIQYDNIRSSVEAFRTFNARFYNGRQISLQFVKIDSWRTAICWSFLNRHCVKGGSCNYLHVFRNPTKEFVSADRDFKPVPSYRPSLPEQNRMAAAVLSSSQRMSCPDITPVGSSCMSSTPSTPRHLEDRNRPLDKSSGSNDRSSSRHQPSPSRTDRKRTKSTKRKRSKSRKSKKHKRSKSPGHKKHKSKKSKKTKHKED
ncbi:Zinc finger CCCH domain-containing protein 5 [Folsomia candida]|uniref:Zinc finger CCCH domain-containing protein 5 n=2 Tax=Folsomia candida TaxID=158441 RepID=A0A226E502_FOLCA|nr:Zinc finger CCCH domain-containing protein 5 [Folsomia candida]